MANPEHPDNVIPLPPPATAPAEEEGEPMPAEVIPAVPFDSTAITQRVEQLMQAARAVDALLNREIGFAVGLVPGLISLIDGRTRAQRYVGREAEIAQAAILCALMASIANLLETAPPEIKTVANQMIKELRAQIRFEKGKTMPQVRRRT